MTKLEQGAKGDSVASNFLVSWARRLKCRFDFWRLDAAHQRLFRVMEIDPDSKIKRGEI